MFQENIKYEMKPVVYRTRRNEIASPKKNTKTIQESLFIKPKSWSYEEEIRFIFNNSNRKFNQDFDYVEFSKESLKRIILGPKILDNDYDKIADFIVAYDEGYKGTKISKCRVSTTEYKLHITDENAELIDAIVE